MFEKNEWMFDDEQLIEEVPNKGESEGVSLINQDCLSDKTMKKVFNYKNRSCLGKFFCCIFCCECPCCINIDPLNEKYYFIRLWNKLTKDSKFNDSNTISPFQTVINLFAHKYVIDDLKKMRLNPNLILLEQGKRNDLEFYIPQLCNFNLFGGQEQVAQFFFFLCNACYASFFFAHRVYWFMRSFENVDCLFKIEHDLKFLNSIFQSENKKNKYNLTNLFVAGSKNYIDYLNNKNFLLFYKKKLELIDKNSFFSQREINYYNNIMNGKKIINSYSEYMCKKALGNTKQSNTINNTNNINAINIIESDKKENEEKPQITSKNFFINNYSFYTQNPVDYAPTEDNLEDYIIINKNEDIPDSNGIDDVNLLSFHSVISFFDDLCKIGRDLKGKDSSEFKEIIIKEITKINKNLPANVYLPFLSDNTRNYIIVHIPVTELKIFKTKERVPFMLVFEMIRLDEILYQIQKENSISIFSLDTNTNILDEEDEDKIKIKDNKYIVDNIIEDDLDNNRNDKQRNSISTFKKIPSEEKKKDKNKKEKKNKKDKNKDKEKNDEELLKIITESDINLSKQISIYLIEEEKKKIENEKNETNFETPTIKTKNSGDELKFSTQKSGLITEYQFSKYQKAFGNNSVNKEHKRSLSFDSLDEDKKKKKKLSMNKTEDEDINTNTNMSNKEDNNDEQKYEINIQENLNIGENLIINNENRNLIENKDNINNNILNEKKNFEDDISSEQSDEDPKNQIITTTTENDKINPIKGGIDIKKIFGEKLKKQKERLQLNSPFKNFKTFNIFKAIIKAGEDLKQEQFATQLISVFREIFSQNGVDVWLSSYEIISTGQDCGLVEMISNSLSMDQIKQKTGLSLKQFYIEYFGGEKHKKYQKAVKNFIRSLAGYSLVCYFLQIKDRHNGNILIDSKGHLIHIDFGFMLSNAPGKGIKFEKAPFKITDEMLELLGGINGDNFKEYRKKLFKGYFAIYDNFEKIQKMAEFMFIGQGKYFPCFIEKENALTNLKERLRPRDNMSKQQKMQYIDDLLSKSIDNWTTTYYDKFQYYIQGIFY